MALDPSVETHGSLGEITIFELLQELEAMGVSGELSVESDVGRATVWFREGQLIDAALGESHGEAAVIRLLGASRATYIVRYETVERMQIINDSASALAGRRMRRAAAWQRLLHEVPPLDSVLVADRDAIEERSFELAADLDLLALVDGRRTIIELIDDSGFDAVAVLERIAAFLSEGLLADGGDSRRFSYSAPEEDEEAIPPVTERLYSLAKDLLADDGRLESDPESRKPETARDGSRASTSSRFESIKPLPVLTIEPIGAPSHSAATFDREKDLTTKDQGGELPSSALTAPAGAPERALLGRYEVLSRIARGGMGTVYLCRTTGEGGFRRQFALKVLRKHLSRHPPAARMFLQEARIAAGIHHPNVVAIIDVGMHEGQPYIVMDYVEGCSFQDLLKRHPTHRPPRLILPVLLDALAGLHAAHTMNEDGKPLRLVHCDVSPHNMLIGVDGTCRLADFGIAKASDAVREASRMAHGKPGYLSPEQARGEPFDHRTDIFAAGIVLFNALTGERLFEGTTAEETIQSVLRRSIPAPSTVGLNPPPALDAICLKALARNPEDRFQTAEEMLHDLRQVAIREDLLAPATDVARWVMDTVGPEIHARRLAALDASRRGRAAGLAKPLTRSLPELDRASDLEAESFVQPPSSTMVGAPPSGEESTTMMLAFPERRRRMLIAAAVLSVLVIGIGVVWPDILASFFTVDGARVSGEPPAAPRLETGRATQTEVPHEPVDRRLRQAGGKPTVADHSDVQ